MIARTPALRTSRREASARLERELETLDRESRLVLTLLLVEGLSEGETAAVLDRSVAGVRALAEDALARLSSPCAGLRRAA